MYIYCCVRLYWYLFPFYKSRVYLHLISVSYITHNYSAHLQVHQSSLTSAALIS